MGQPYASHNGNVLRIGFAEVNSQVSCTGYEKTRPGDQFGQFRWFAQWNTRGAIVKLTCYDFWALEVLIRMEIARRQGKVDAREDQQEIDSAPHSGCGCDGPRDGCERQGRLMSGVVVEEGSQNKASDIIIRLASCYQTPSRLRLE